MELYLINKQKVRCPRCGSDTSPAVALNGGASKDWLKCKKCNTYIDTHIPLPWQYDFYKDSTRYRMPAGGYGTGKTTADFKDRMKKAVLTPGGQTLFGANTFPQLNSTLKKDLEADLPEDFVGYYSVQKNEFSLINGHGVLYRSLDDPEKYKSLNLSAYSIIEGSGVKQEVNTQLQSRLRNTAAGVPMLDEHGNPVIEFDEEGNPQFVLKADWRSGVIETNPDPGWVLTGFLEESGRVAFYNNTYEKYDYHDTTPYKSSYIVPTAANYMLPKDYEKEQTQNKPAWWVKRYFKGSFRYAEGLVFPNYSDALVKPFAIPRNWKRLIAMDYGISDKTHFIFGAIDPKDKICYLYDELIINNADVSEIVREYRKKLREIPEGGLLFTPVMDQRSMSKRQSDDMKKTLGDLFEDEGVIFDPAQMDMDARILRMNTLINNGQLKIFTILTGLIGELKNHKFPERTLENSGSASLNKPKDGNDHGVAAAEFLCMELPPNLAQYDLRVYNNGKPVTPYRKVDINVKPKIWSPFTTKEEKNDNDFVDSFFNDHGDNLYHYTGGFDDIDKELDIDPRDL